MDRPKLPSRAHWDRLFFGGKYGDHRVAGALDDAERIGMRGWLALEMAENEAEGLRGTSYDGDGGSHGDGGHSDPVLELVGRKVDLGQDGPPVGTIPDPVGEVMTAMATAQECVIKLAACRRVIDQFQASTATAAPVGSRKAVDSTCELCDSVVGPIRRGLCPDCMRRFTDDPEPDTQLWTIRQKAAAASPLATDDEIADRRAKKRRERFEVERDRRLKQVS